MDALTPAALVHFYDTRRHEILCGMRGFAQRSTKHSRNVTCNSCVGLLASRRSPDATATEEAPATDPM